MIFHAPRYTHVAASQTASVIAGGSSIKVLGITVQGTSNGQVVVLEKDGTTVIMEISVLANSQSTVDVPFVANNGVNITTPSGVTCTVFHTQVS